MRRLSVAKEASDAPETIVRGQLPQEEVVRPSLRHQADISGQVYSEDGSECDEMGGRASLVAW